MEPQSPQIAKATLRKKSRAGGITLSDFRLYYKATVIRTAWYQHKNRHVDKWNRIENPEIDPNIYGQLIYDKEGKNIERRKDYLFSKWCWENLTATCKIMRFKHSFTLYAKIKSKSKDLNVKMKIINVLEMNISRTLFDINHSNVFLDWSPQAKETKAKINKWDLIKLKRFCPARETVNKTIRQPMDWEKIFTNDVTSKGLISKVNKQLIQLNIKQTTQ